MPSQVSHHTSHSRSPSPTPSTTQQLDAPCSKCTSTKRHKKHPVSSDSKGSSSDVPPHVQCKKQSKHNSTRALYQEILQAIQDSRVSHSTGSALSCAPLTHYPVDPAEVVAPLSEGNPFVTIDQHLSKHLVKLVCDDKFVDLSKLAIQSPVDQEDKVLQFVQRHNGETAYKPEQELHKSGWSY